MDKACALPDLGSPTSPALCLPQSASAAASILLQAAALLPGDLSARGDEKQDAAAACHRSPRINFARPSFTPLFP